VVVSNAGGEAVTDARGEYRLELHVPPGAASVQLTAAATSAGRNLVATAQVAVPGTPPVLSLVASGGCGSWIPTFGGLPGVGDDTSSPPSGRSRSSTMAAGPPSRRRRLHGGRRGAERHREVGRDELVAAPPRVEQWVCALTCSGAADRRCTRAAPSVPRQVRRS
jgi:hypothetical protein